MFPSSPDRCAWRAAGACLLAALAVLATGCGGGQGSGAGADATVVKQPALATEALPFHEVEVGVFSGEGDPGTVAVNDDLGWSSVWTRHTSNLSPAPPRPLVDFAGRTVAAVFLGKQTGCTRPVVEAVTRHGDARIVVQYRVDRPAAGQICPAVIMTPVHMVRFENANRLPVDFKQR